MMDALQALKQIRTPIVNDTIERFNVRPHNEGYMESTIRSMLPSLGVLVGYACTGKIVCEPPPSKGETSMPWKEVWRYVGQCRRPSVMVVQDLDSPPPKGCAWGDVAASIFTAQGCVGAITNGGVRDLREVEALGFHLFASSAVVGHAYVRYVAIGTPVKVGGLVINPGDLIHADEHGVLVIPEQVPLDDLVRRARELLDREQSIVRYCLSEKFDLDELSNRLEADLKRLAGNAR